LSTDLHRFQVIEYGAYV